MTRNLKALGLLLLAIFALGAFGASSAFAEESEEEKSTNVYFHSEQENTTLTIHESTAQTFRAGPEGSPVGTVTCPHVSIDAPVVPKTTKDLTVEKISYATTQEETEKCTITAAPGTFKAHVDFNSCYYTFTTSPGTAVEDKIKGSVHIKCKTPGDSITVTATILGQSVACLHIPEQTPTEKTVYFTSTGTGTTRSVLLIAKKVEGITYTLTAACNKGTEVEKNDAIYEGEATITGEDALGNHVGIWVE